MKNIENSVLPLFVESKLCETYGESTAPVRNSMKIPGNPDRTMEKVLQIPGMEVLFHSIGNCEENAANFPNGEQARLECIVGKDEFHIIGYSTRSEITYRAGEDTFNLINRRIFYFKEITDSLETVKNILPGDWHVNNNRNMPVYRLSYQGRPMMVIIYPDDCALFMFDNDLGFDTMAKLLLSPLTTHPELLHEVKSPEETSALKKLLINTFGPSALPTRALAKVDGDPAEVSAKIKAISEFVFAETLSAHCGKYVWNTDDGEQPRLICDLDSGKKYIIGLGIREDIGGYVKRRVIYLKNVSEDCAYFDELFGKPHSFNEYDKLNVHRMKFKDVDFFVHEMGDCDLIITGFWEDEIMLEINKAFAA